MHFFNNNTEALGWALLHFLWQGTVVALLLGLCLRALRQRTAQVRYALAGLGLLLMLGAFLGTLAVVWERPEVAVVSENRSHETYRNNGADTTYQEPAVQPTVMREAAPLVISQPPPVAATPLAEAAPLPAPVPVPFSEKVRPYLPWAVGLWAVGVVCFAMRFLFALLAVRGWKRSGQDIVSTEWKQRFSQLRAALEVSRPVQFLSSAAIAVPMVIGWLKPVVLVPAGLFTGLTTAQLEAILAHELAHIRRHDYLANLFQHFMETLFFYHPAVWWVSGRMREAREHCCDDLAASACGGALGYAKALTALEELRGVAPVLSISATGGSLLARIRRILGLPEEKSRSWPLGLLAVLALAIIPFALAKEEGRPGPTKGSGTLPLLERGGGILPPSPDASPAAPAPDAAKGQPTPTPNISPDPASAKADGRDAHATNLPGTWAMAGGVSLHIYGEVNHGSDVDTTAILSWPALGNRPAQHWSTWIAGDAFAARSLYAVAWDAQHAVLWIASRDVGSTAQNAAGKPIANRFKRVDFSNPNLITETYSNGWPKHHPPSAEVMAQMSALMEVPLDPQPEASTLYSWSTTGNPERINLANAQNLSVVQGKDGKLTVSLQSEKKSASMDELSQTIKALALDWEMKRAATIGDLKPTQRVTIAGDDISAEALRKIIQGCTKASFGPLKSGAGLQPASRGAMSDLQGLLEIRESGTYKYNDHITIIVTSVSVEGSVQNTLKIQETDVKGKVVTDTCALPYGEGSWALLVSSNLPKGTPGTCQVCMASPWGVQRYAFDASEQARFGKPGFDDSARWQATAKQLETGELPQFADHAEVAWARQVMPKLRPAAVVAEPTFELRLVSNEKDVPELIRPTGIGLLARFVGLGAPLLRSEELESGFVSTKGTQWGPTNGVKERYRRLLTDYAGRKAALVSEGRVLDTFTLDPKHESFLSRGVEERPIPAPMQDRPKASGTGVPPVSPSASPTEPNLEPTKAQPAPNADISPDPASAKADGRDAHATTWAATGRVTDAEGHPMPDVEIWVATRMGSLKSQGPIKTDADGRYRVEFLPGFTTSKDAPGLQFANITARKSGFTEKNLSRHGTGSMAAQEVPSEDLKGYPNGLEGLSLPGKPRQVDFVMLPSVTIKGRLLGNGNFSKLKPSELSDHLRKHRGEPLPKSETVELKHGPLAGWKVWLKGKDLPPGASVIAVVSTDAEGNFEMPDVPPGFEWQFQCETNLMDHKEPWSRLFKADDVRAELVILELDEKQGAIEWEERGGGVPPVSPDAPPGKAITNPIKRQPPPTAGMSSDPASAEADGRDAHATMVPPAVRSDTKDPSMFVPAVKHVSVEPMAGQKKAADELMRNLIGVPETETDIPALQLKVSIGEIYRKSIENARTGGGGGLQPPSPDVKADTESDPQAPSARGQNAPATDDFGKDISMWSTSVRQKPPLSLAPEINDVQLEINPDQPRGLGWLEAQIPYPTMDEVKLYKVNRKLGDFPSPNDPRMGQIHRAMDNAGGVANPGPAPTRPEFISPGKALITSSDPADDPTADPFAPPTAPDKLAEARKNGIQIKVMDAEGKPLKDFRVIAGVPSSVSAEFEKTHNVRVANWQSHTLHFGHREGLIWPLDKAYNDMALRVEADGYVPQMVAGLDRKKGGQELSFKLVPDQGVSGSVTLPDGKSPASKATVVLAMIRRNFRYEAKEARSDDIGDLADTSTTPREEREEWEQPRSVSADDAGKFTLPTEIDPTAVVCIYHQDGVREMPYAKWRKNPNVTLQPWGRIHGHVQWGDKVGAGETIDLSVNHGDAYGYPDIISQSDSTVSDAEGNFVFERVLPGLAQLSIPFKTKDAKGAEFTTYQDGMIIHADVKAPQTEVSMGGVGRLVKGQLTGRENWDGVTFHFHPTAPHIGFAGDETMWQAWQDFQKSPKGPVFFRDGLKVNVDGSFAIPGMLPGRYQIFFSKDGEKSHVASSQFTVEVEKPNVKPDNMILPEIKASREEGRPAPPERGKGVPPVSPGASPPTPTPDTPKSQPTPKGNVSHAPASAKADGRDAHATVSFAEHCKKVAEGKGVANELNAITTWGEEQQGLQAGLIMLGKAAWGTPCSGWIVVRNPSATETREFVLCQSSNTLHFLAEDEHGNALTCQDWLGKLFGNDALIPKKLGPSEQLEFPIDAITISQFADQPAPSIHLPEKERTCRLWFDLDQIILPQIPMKSFTTGKVMMNLVNEPKVESQRREAAKQIKEQAKAVPKVELLQDAEDSLLVITRGVQRVRIYSSEPLKHALTVDMRPKEEAWSLHGDIIVEHKDGTLSKLPTNWTSDASEKFVVNDQEFQGIIGKSGLIRVVSTSQSIVETSADSEGDDITPWPRPKGIFLRIQPDGKVQHTAISFDENDFVRIRQSLQEQDSMAAKYTLSRELAHSPRGVIEWTELQPDGEKMLKLRISHQGEIKYLPSRDKIIARSIEPESLQEIISWLKKVNSRFPLPMMTEGLNGELQLGMSIPLFPKPTNIRLMEKKEENSTSFRYWSPNDDTKDSAYEQIKARLMELVK